jgi:hypothetical protein
MPSYRELLFSQEWRTKRNEILKRDSFCCSNCSNKLLIEDFNSGVIHFHKLEKLFHVTDAVVQEYFQNIIMLTKVFVLDAMVRNMKR